MSGDCRDHDCLLLATRFPSRIWLFPSASTAFLILAMQARITVQVGLHAYRCGTDMMRMQTCCQTQFCRRSGTDSCSRWHGLQSLRFRESEASFCYIMCTSQPQEEGSKTGRAWHAVPIRPVKQCTKCRIHAGMPAPRQRHGRWTSLPDPTHMASGMHLRF